MDVRDVLDHLQADEVFLGWRREHKNAYLAHLFCMIEAQERAWQAGFVTPADNMVTVFSIAGGVHGVTASPPDAPFSPKGSIVPPLDMAQVGKTLTEALSVAVDCQQEKYPAEIPFKTIAILQTIEKDPIYNMTYVTQTFKTLNIRVSAKTGAVIDDKLVSFFSFAK